MSFDGLTEQDQIEAHAKLLFGGRVEAGMPDTATHQRYLDGGVKPYAYILFDPPVPYLAARSMTDGTGDDIPQVMGFSVIVASADSRTARQAGAAMRKHLVDWAPNASAEPIEAVGGYPSDARGRYTPPRFEEGTFFKCLFNMGG